MVRTFLKVYMELDFCFLFLQEQIKGIIILAPRGVITDRNGSSFLPGTLQPGARGVRWRVWWNRGTTEIETLRGSTYFNSSNVDEIEMSRFESAI